MSADPSSAPPNDPPSSGESGSESSSESSRQSGPYQDGGLVSRNLTIGRRRTSVRLEAEMWDWLLEVSTAHGLSVHRFCTMVDGARRPKTSLTAAIRVEIARFYRAQARRYSQALETRGLPVPEAQSLPVDGT